MSPERRCWLFAVGSVIGLLINLSLGYSPRMSVGMIVASATLALAFRWSGPSDAQIPTPTHDERGERE